MWLAPKIPWERARYWALDIESSGIDPKRSTILSVGMVPIIGGRIDWGSRYAAFVRPDDGVGDRSTVAVHQLTEAELQDASTIESVLPEVLGRLAGQVLVVHHAALDVGLLHAAARRAEVLVPELRVVDTVRLIERYNDRGAWLGRRDNPVPLGLSRARAHFGLPRHEEHDALADALATAELMLCLRAKLDVKTLRQLL